ncbi:Peptidoglycan-N-acetylmuramic acid deacetylase PdaC [bioreactor metagenome]|uniref:Peptidoglycan-N-acetylmuramic acid deacetylase PdaC n=1 Tax=bioreactor metagenome TaxID=1076179 RepID=A0A645E4N7_9ZZZZ
MNLLKNVIAAAAPKRDLPIYNVDRQELVCALTFDAAWGNEDTDELISILGLYDIKATFFVVGQWVDKYPESVKALSDAGHEVMNHSNTHPHLPQLSREKIIEEITKCDEKIEKVTGVRPTLTRPPYGDYNDKVVSTLRSIGHFTIQWDVDSSVIKENTKM